MAGASSRTPPKEPYSSRDTPYLSSKRLYPARLGRWPRRRPGRAPSPGSAQAARHDAPGAVARQKQPGWDEPEETLQAPRTVEARRDGDATMQPAVRLLLGSLPQPVCWQPEATVIAGSQLEEGGVAGQFGETTTNQPSGFTQAASRLADGG